MSNLNLYQIQNDYIVLANEIIDNEGLITPEQETALQINKDQLEQKGRGYGFIIKTLEAEIDIIDSEIKRLLKFKTSRNGTIERLKESITNAMNLYDITEIKTPTLKINFRKSESVEVENIALLEQKFVTTKITQTADKAEIKAAIKAGETVTGAILQTNSNLQIK